MRRIIPLLLLIPLMLFARKEEMEGDFPKYPPPDSTGFNMIVDIGEINDTMMFANDEAFYFDPDEVEVTDATGRFVKLSSVTTPADAQLLVVRKDNQNRVKRIRITALYNEEWEPRSLSLLITDTKNTIQGSSKSAPPTPSGKAVFGTSHNNGEKK